MSTSGSSCRQVSADPTNDRPGFRQIGGRTLHTFGDTTGYFAHQLERTAEIFGGLARGAKGRYDFLKVR